jgi:putative membrane protein
MGTEAWLTQDARRTVRDLVRAIEAKTSAEIVVTVRAQSATYREIDLAVGAAFAFAALAVYVYFPFTFYDDLAPIGIALCFAAGAIVSSVLVPLKRLFLGQKKRRESVRNAARVAFYDQGIAGTRARTGVLVFVSLLEREVEVVADSGVAVNDMGTRWTENVAKLEAALRKTTGLESFTASLGALGEALAEKMPVGADDVNELPDEMAG